MRRHKLVVLAGVIAAVAWSQAPASAQSIDAGGVSVSVGGLPGTSSAVVGDPSGGGAVATGTATGGAATGGSGPTEAIVTLGGAGTASGTGPATATVTLGGLAAGDPYGSAVIVTGPSPVGGGTTGTVILGAIPGTPGAPGAPGGTVGPGGLTQTQLAGVLANLSDNDVQALKLKCVDVIANPAGYDAGTIGVCQLLATL